MWIKTKVDGAFMKWLFLKVGWYRTGLYKIDIICFVASNHHNSTVIFFTEKKNGTQNHSKLSAAEPGMLILREKWDDKAVSLFHQVYP